ncbi:hypothetical protein Cflav_PD4660 [Pedosphaera parvula Ellin514]|uniref:Uncharacterized protein n=2 Tax=Pedosphaera TaxID=1032526 RepID=B9XEA6_PEDPL|nr:hypothetical protein Cflav_PD4660 [Pedosphaera parvula Ellin514]
MAQTDGPVIFAADGPSLQAAITQANSSGGAHTIVLSTNATYGFNTPDNYWYGPNALPPIASDITIEGNGSIIQRTTTSRLRFFYVGADPGNPATVGYNSPGAGKLTLRHLTLTNGLALGGNGGGGGAGMGGAIFSQGTLILDAVTLSRNVAQGGNGGTESQTSYGGHAGGGMGQDGGGWGQRGGGFGGAVIPAGSQGAVHGGGGGFGTNDNAIAIQGGGPSNGLGGGVGISSSSGGNGSGNCLNNSTNSGVGGNFGLGGTGGTGIGDTMGTDGSGGGGGGGGIGGGGGGGGIGSYSGGGGGGGGFGGGGGVGGAIGVDGAGGHGGFGGGGGGGGGGIDGPFAGGYGGGDSGFSIAAGSGGGAGMGGAIFNHNGVLSMTNCTLALNGVAGGNGGNLVAVGPPGTMYIGGGSGSGLGGAIFNLNGTITLTSSTLASNVVIAGVPGAGGTAGQAAGGAVYNLVYDSATNRTATITMVNSILAGSSGGVDLVIARPNYTTAATNRGAAVVIATEPNLVQSFTNSGGSFTNSGVILANPLLGPLANNGGGTSTMKLLQGSPALDAGDSALAPFLDQLGGLRVSGLKVDLGAVELQVPTLFGGQFLGNGQYGFSFSGNPANTYRVFGSTNPALPFGGWTLLGQASQSSNGVFQFNDVQAGNYPTRFYRVSQP